MLSFSVYLAGSGLGTKLAPGACKLCPLEACGKERANNVAPDYESAIKDP